MKNKIITLILIISTIFLSGCAIKSKKPILLFNSQKINAKTIYDAQKIFKPNQKVYYVILMPNGFKKEYLRMQIIKREDKVVQGGANIYMSKDLFIDASKKYYIDSFSIGSSGTFVVRFFYGNKLEKPFLENILWIK